MSCPLDEPQRVEEERNVAGNYYLIIYISYMCTHCAIFRYISIYGEVHSAHLSNDMCDLNNKEYFVIRYICKCIPYSHCAFFIQCSVCVTKSSAHYSIILFTLQSSSKFLCHRFSDHIIICYHRMEIFICN